MRRYRAVLPKKGIGGLLARYVVFFLCYRCGPSNASTAVDSCEARLHTAWSSGALTTREEYDLRPR